MMEDMLTVTKQKDMSGFYRHIYRQTMGEEKGQKEETVAAVTIKTEPDIKTEVEEGETQDDIAAPSTEVEKKKVDKVKARSYRTKAQDEDSEPSGNEDSDSQMESDSDSSGNKPAQNSLDILTV